MIALQPTPPGTKDIPLKVARKSSKPIINWLQRKLGGGTHRRATVATSNGHSSSQRKQNPRQSDRPRSHSRANVARSTSMDNEIPVSLRRSTISSWKDSNSGEADEDASMRPIPPTSPSSPVPSRSSSSFVSDPHTFKSATAASTRPTTLLSIDLGTGANGMAHIAQAPSTPNSIYNFNSNHSPQFSRFGLARGSGSISSLSPNNVTFSSLPSSSSATVPGRGTVQAPLHTHHHPRYNPRPGSPPNENASMITLASSAYGLAGQRYTDVWAGSDSQSQLMSDNASASHSHSVLLDDLLPEETNMDASVRALRPRSSRHASWDSEMSKWSIGSPVTGCVQDRSIRTAPSIRVKPAEEETVETEKECGEGEMRGREEGHDECDRLSGSTGDS